MNTTDKFLQAYIVAALWSSTDESTPEGGDPLDKNYGPDDLAPETLERMKADCEQVSGRERPATLKAMRSRPVTISGSLAIEHGCGFWDGDWPETGDRLTEACRKYPEVTLYVGDDGLIYC